MSNAALYVCCRQAMQADLSIKKDATAPARTAREEADDSTPASSSVCGLLNFTVEDARRAADALRIPDISAVRERACFSDEPVCHLTQPVFLRAETPPAQLRWLRLRLTILSRAWTCPPSARLPFTVDWLAAMCMRRWAPEALSA